MLIKGVLFDLFGTLLSYGEMEKAWQAWECALKEYLIKNINAHDYVIRPETLSTFFTESPPLKSEYLSFSTYEARLHRMYCRNGFNLDQRQLGEVATESIRVWEDFITVDPEAIPLLNQLQNRGYKLGLITNFDHSPHIHHLLEREGLKSFFDTLVISDAVGLKKPDPKIFHLACAQLRVEPSQCLYIGDDPEADFWGAEQAGLKAILIQKTKQFKRAHYEVDSDGESMDTYIPPIVRHEIQSLSEVLLRL
jgi:putative hydrolase of the HAD superfamily